ncbi:MAG TPA: hypothetical protein VMF50_03125 [Candidatus Binataceae bacterium]|nr:hypothetical protein [Candidatus Binataceae bacterium]
MKVGSVMRLCVGTSKGIVILDTARGGVPLLISADPPSVWCLARDCYDPRIIYAGSVQNAQAGSARGKGSLARSADGGRTWQDITPPAIRDEEVWAAAASIHRTGELIIGTSRARVLRSTDGGRSFQECGAFRKISGRDRWSLPVSPYRPRVRSITFDPTDPESFYVGVEVGGLFRSPDGGGSFERLNHGLPADVQCVAADPSDRSRLYVATGQGLYVSADRGASWSRAKGLSRHYAVTLFVGGYDAESLYLAAAAGPPPQWSIGSLGADAMLFRSSDRGSSFVPFGANGEAGPSRAMLMRMAAGAEGDGLMYGAFNDGSVVQINERQGSMRTIAEKLPPAYDLIALSE